MAIVVFPHISNKQNFLKDIGERKSLKGLDITIAKRSVFGINKSGAECGFIKLTRNVGVKIYRTELQAKNALARQAKAYQLGFAPKVYSHNVEKCLANNLHFEDGYYDCGIGRVFGYFYKTQIAKTTSRYPSEKLENRLRKLLKKVGLGGGDIHEGNIGKIGSKWVVIDFGKYS